MVDRVGRYLTTFEMGGDDRSQPRSKVAGGGLLEDADLLGLPGFVQLDEHGWCAVAPTQARDALDLDARVVAEVIGNRFEPCEASRRSRKWQAMSRQTRTSTTGGGLRRKCGKKLTTS